MNYAVFKHQFNRRRTSRLLILLIFLGAVVVGAWVVGPRGSQAQSGGQDPDYGGVDDFLNGGTHLLRDDDLVMTFNYNGANNESRGVLFTAGATNSQLTFLNYDQHTIPQGPGCADSGGCNYDYHQFISNRPVAGRFFNTDKDTTVHYPVLLDGYPYFVSLAGKATTSTPPAAGLTWTSAQSINFVTGGNAFLSVVGDFNGDGYDDLLMGYSDTTKYPPSVPHRLRIATAVDPNNPGQGFKFGPEFAVSDQSAIREMTVGDFDGDRLPEIAYLSVAQNSDLNLFTFKVDPATLSISAGGSVKLYTLASVAVNTALTMTAGHFTPVANQQLAVGFHIGSGKNFEVQIVDFDPNTLQPKLKTTFDVPDASNDPVLKLKAGRLNWSNPFDQIVWMSSTIDNGTRLEVLTVDPVSLAVTVKANTVFSGDGDSNAVVFGRDIALGNFDHMQQSAADPTQQERDPDLQIAMIALRVNRKNGQIGTAGVAICDVSEDFSTIKTTSYSVLDESYFGGNSLTEMSIAAGDLQGRSYRLGKPAKLQFESAIQPTVIAGMPPMHVDYVPPANTAAPTIFNMSFVPDSFNTQFAMTDTSTTNTSTTNTTSWSFGAKEQFSYGNEVGSVKAGDGTKWSDTFTATQKLKGSTDTLNGTYSNYSFSLQAQTVYGDNVFYTSNRFNMWIYPVIGRMVCRSDKGSCPPDDLVPLTIQFSAPDQIDNPPVEAGPGIEWYQPPWEPGNIFSYPGSLSQLQQIVGLDPITKLTTMHVLSESATFSADSNKLSASVNWENGQTGGTTTSASAKFSFENDYSFAMAGGLPLVDKGTFTADVDISGSYGFGQVTTTNTALGKSNGITINKPSIPNQDQYRYSFSPYIFGRTQPGGVSDNQQLAANVTTFGLLQTAFIVNPIRANQSTWWDQTYTAPDVALNHPARWNLTKPPLNSPIPRNCLTWDGSSQMDCIDKNDDNPSDPWTSSFHHMRGFFISSANNPNLGPNLGSAVTGDQLALTTRVYNYSLANMPGGAQVHVRFYGQQWDTSDSGGPSNTPIGNSFLIGETQLAPISRFNPTPNAPLNWVFASVNFDTTPYVDKYLTFFVIAWIQLKDGTIVAEMPSHGLKSTFDPTASINSFSDLAAFGEDFSNNIGFYNSAFYIYSKPAAAAARKALTASETATLRMIEVKTSTDSLKVGQRIEVLAVVQAGDQALSGLTARFFDGDPAKGGKVFDSERIPHIRANEKYGLRVRYTLNDCGSHRLYVQVGNGRPDAVSGQSQPVQVECPAPVCTVQVCMKSPQHYAVNPNQLPRGMVAVAGRNILSNVSTSNTMALKLALQGGNAAQQYFNQQFVALQLNLLGANDPGGRAEQSNLLCYRANFQPVTLSTNFTLSPNSKLGELLTQARIAARSGNAIDQRTLANVMNLINGNDPQGRCR